MKNKFLLLSILAALMLLTACATTAPAEKVKPSDGWTLHIDAKKHFPGNKEMYAHHYCKPVANGLIECQLYDSDEKDARLVGIEVVIDTKTYQGFSDVEKIQKIGMTNNTLVATSTA